MGLKSMKTLQDNPEFRWAYEAHAISDGVVRRSTEAKEVILLLHGLSERGRRIYRKLFPYLPPEAIILAPNAPYPLPTVKTDRMDYGYTWYFFDRFTREYYIPMDVAISSLLAILKIENPQNLPVTIIGFSQGGYLAPVLSRQIPLVKKVIGIGCEFKPNLVGANFTHPLYAIHGENDSIILPEEAQAHLENLECQWHLIPETGHEINSLVGMKIKEILEQ